MNAERLELLNVEQLADLLGVTPAAVRRLFLLKKLPGRKIGKRWHCTRAALERRLEGQQQ